MGTERSVEMKKRLVFLGVLVTCSLAVLGAAKADDPFADATVWIRGWNDANGDGLVQGTEVRSALSNATPWSAATPRNQLAYTNEWVTMPYRGAKRLTAALSFPQTVTITNEAEKTGWGRVSTLTLDEFSSRAGVTNDTYSFAIRFRPDNSQFRTDYAWIFNWGYNNKVSGFNLGLSNGNVSSNWFNTGSVTNWVVYRTYTPSFFKNGNEYNPFGNCADVVRGGFWHDLVMSIDGRNKKVRYMLSRAHFDKDVPPVTVGRASDVGGQQTWSNEVAMSVLDGFSFKPAETLILGSESTISTDCVYMNDGRIDGNATKCFRGDIGQFAVWNRALDFEEMKMALAWPRGDLMRAGVRDGGSAEFRGGTVTDADAAEWTIPSSFAAGDAASVSFTLDRKGEEDMPQLFRWFGASDSAIGSVRLDVNGKTVGKATVQPGHATYWKVKEGFLVAGANTLTVTRVDNQAGLVRPDALALGGSWQIGHKDGSYNEFAHESFGKSHHDVLDGNWYSIKRVMFGSVANAEGKTGGENVRMVYHFARPAEFADGGLYAWTLAWKDLANSANHLPRWRLNGHDLGWTAAANAGYHTLDVPDEYFVPGENTLEIYNADTFVKGQYYSLDYFRLMVSRRGGTFLFMR